jgi:hypothetical protein
MYSDAWAPSIADGKNDALIDSEFGAGSFDVNFHEDDESYDRPPSVSGIKNVRFCLYFYIISFFFLCVYSKFEEIKHISRLINQHMLRRCILPPKL